MTVYVDLVFFLNLFFDFLLLLTVNNTLKRNTSLKRIFLGALVGSITIFTLFLSISSILLFLFKIVLSILMCTISFGIKDKKYVIQNLSYFYMTSTVLGGFLYFLNLTFAESHYGLIFSYFTRKRWSTFPYRSYREASDGLRLPAVLLSAPPHPGDFFQYSPA